MFTRQFAKLLLLLPLSLLPGCESFVSSDVVSFHEGSLPKGESIRIEASDPTKAQSLEFRSYARMIGAQLDKVGYRYVEDAATVPTLIAQVDYSVNVGPTNVRVERPISPFVRYRFNYGGFYDPFYMGIDAPWPDDVVSTPNFVSNFSMVIVKNTEERPHVFEGRVQSITPLNQMPELMPYLITAMFTNFPGESGVTKVVTIQMDRPTQK